MKKYKKRIADKILQKKLNAKGAVLIEGAKWCGKTTTASQIAKSILSMQNPEEKEQNIRLAELSPSRLLHGKTPRLIDEWQLAPKLWDAVRFEVDKRDEFNQFILTGSAVPADLKEITHTGTGRISRMLMRPMSLFESQESNGSVSLAELFSSKTNIDGENTIDIDELAFLICRGGWPKAIGLKQYIGLSQAIDYYDAVVNSDISRVDNIERNPERAKRLLRAYARSIGTQTKLTSLSDDVNEDNNLGTNPTIYNYINALQKIFVIEDSHAWNPNLRSKAAIRTTDTRYFTDPSIAAAALGLGPNDLIDDIKTMGFFFENLCIRDLRVYADSLDGTIYHYRDKNGLECDAVIHLRNGAYGLIEIKLGGDKAIEEGKYTLNKLAENIDYNLMKKPSFKMVITGTGKYAYKDGDTFIVPIGCLKD
jgi:predicted AAA+ superfamily ATPase